jgi:hypothetical protein
MLLFRQVLVSPLDSPFVATVPLHSLPQVVLPPLSGTSASLVLFTICTARAPVLSASLSTSLL